MDQAWALEQTFWDEISKGRAGDFYGRSMIAEGYVVLPTGIVGRDELIVRWAQHEPVKRYELGEPRMTLVDGGNVVISYEVTVDASWLPNYRAWMTAIYTWEGKGWALAVRTHTPISTFPF